MVIYRSSSFRVSQKWFSGKLCLNLCFISSLYLEILLCWDMYCWHKWFPNATSPSLYMSPVSGWKFPTRRVLQCHINLSSGRCPRKHPCSRLRNRWIDRLQQNSNVPLATLWQNTTILRGRGLKTTLRPRWLCVDDDGGTCIVFPCPFLGVVCNLCCFEDFVWLQHDNCWLCGCLQIRANDDDCECLMYQKEMQFFYLLSFCSLALCSFLFA